MAIEPIAVKAHDNSDTAPSCAMLVGSMMMPDPIMLTVTSVVSPIRLIFLLESVIANSLSRLAGCGCSGLARPHTSRALGQKHEHQGGRRLIAGGTAQKAHAVRLACFLDHQAQVLCCQRSRVSSLPASRPRVTTK
jgi:hypothetical protein